MVDTKFAKRLVILNGAVPLALLTWDAFHHQLGANPTNYAILTTGLMALIFLSLSLLVTPVRKLTGQNWLISVRRSLGLYAFYYAAIHFLIFFWFDREHSVGGTVKEVWSRWYLIVGTLGLVAMAPLAVTSTNGMVRRLGAKKWQLLHRLAYVAIVAGCIHYYLQAKSDKRQPLAFMGVAGALLLYRGVAFAVKPKPKMPIGAGKAKFWKGQLRVIETRQETPSVRTFRLASIDGGPLPFEYRPGQYLNLTLIVDGTRVNRSYTIASSPTQRGYCEITVKREDRGISSGHLHGRVKVGDVVQVGAPAGGFTFSGEDANGIVLLGGGVGITPLMSVTRFLTDKNWPGEIYLVHVIKTEADAIFGEELATLARRHPNLHVTTTCTRAGEGYTGLRGRLTPELLNRIVPNLTSHRVHVCGPDEMMAATRQMLESMGVPAGQIKFEAFTSTHAAEPVGETSGPLPDGAAAEVTFAKAGKTATAAPQTVILDVAEACGVNIESECRSGICGTCKIRLKSGSVFMETRDALSRAEEESGLILACQAQPVGSVTVDA